MTETWSGFIFADPVAAATPNAVATISPSTADATESFMIPPSVPWDSSQVEAPPSARCSYLARPSLAIHGREGASFSIREDAPYRLRASALALACVVSRSKSKLETLWLARPEGPPVLCACSASLSQRNPRHRQ